MELSFQSIRNFVTSSLSSKPDMAFDHSLADRIREYLVNFPDIIIEEKKMFSGLAFIVNDKMCVNVSGDNLMCRFDPELQNEIAHKPGFETMIMRGQEMKGYCYVSPNGLRSEKEFEYWLDLCLDYNRKAKSSKRNKG